MKLNEIIRPSACTLVLAHGTSKQRCEKKKKKKGEERKEEGKKDKGGGAREIPLGCENWQ